MSVDYPVSLKIDYPDRKLNRLTSFFRIFTIIPILIVLMLLMGGSFQMGAKEAGTVVSGVGLIMLPLVLMLLFRQKYPKWWYDWNLNLSKFSYRVASYFYLMTDVYPSTDEEQNVQLDMPYPDAAGLNRWLPLVKWFLAIPHIIVLCFLWVAALVVIIIVWFAILFTGRYPRGLFDFALGVMRWGFRVMCYAMIMITDKYPPFALDT
ncbi:MAG: DUF4389 domain-containing protein [Dehalococcoidia bacterium]|nr:DUF4389 domain-containing protein [Dehalococcoidia bacterium]